MNFLIYSTGQHIQTIFINYNATFRSSSSIRLQAGLSFHFFTFFFFIIFFLFLALSFLMINYATFFPYK